MVVLPQNTTTFSFFTSANFAFIKTSVHVIELDILLIELFDWYNQNKNKIYPLHLAAIFIVHLRFVSIHFFGDGNGEFPDY